MNKLQQTEKYLQCTTDKSSFGTIYLRKNKIPEIHYFHVRPCPMLMQSFNGITPKLLSNFLITPALSACLYYKPKVT